jgi:flagellar biosynthesis component FlhA
MNEHSSLVSVNLRPVKDEALDPLGSLPVLPFSPPLLLHATMQCFHKRRHAEEDAQPREQHPQKQDTVAHAKKKQKHAATSRASQAAALSAQAHTHRLQITVCTQFARVLSAADTCTIKERADKIAAQLAEDSKRSIPLLNFSFQLEVSTRHT